MRESKWFLWKQKYLPEMWKIKRLFMWLFYFTVAISSIVGAAVIGLYIGGNVTISF